MDGIEETMDQEITYSRGTGTDPATLEEQTSKVMAFDPTLTLEDARAKATRVLDSLREAQLRAAVEAEQAADEARMQAQRERFDAIMRGAPLPNDYVTAAEMVADLKGEARPPRPVVLPPVFVGVRQIVNGPLGDGFYLEQTSPQGTALYPERYASMVDALNAGNRLSRG